MCATQSSSQPFPSLFNSNPSSLKVWDQDVDEGAVVGAFRIIAQLCTAPEVDGQASDVPPSEIATIQEVFNLSSVSNQETKDLLCVQARCQGNTS